MGGCTVVRFYTVEVWRCGGATIYRTRFVNSVDTVPMQD